MKWRQILETREEAFRGTILRYQTTPINKALPVPIWESLPGGTVGYPAQPGYTRCTWAGGTDF